MFHYIRFEESSARALGPSPEAALQPQHLRCAAANRALGPSSEAAQQSQHLGWPVRAVREREAKPKAKEAESRMARKGNPRKAGTA
jgi:hypothetical protein